MTQTVNLFKNPSAETNSTGYYTRPGTSGAATLSNPTTGGFSGTHYVLSTWTTSSTAAGGGAAVGHATNTGVERIDIVGSTQYTATLYVKPSKAKTLLVSGQRLDNTGTQVGNTAGTAIAVTAATWTPITVSFTSESTATRLSLIITDTDGTFWLIGDTLGVDAVMVCAGATVPPYGDPSTSQFWVWSGTAHASTSTLFTPVVTVTGFTDANPCPRALIAINDFPPAVATVTLSRTAEGRSFPVRGGVNLFAPGGISLPDYEIPFGVPVNYQAQMFDNSSNSLGNTSVGTVTLAVTQSWMHQPLSPTLAIPARVFVTTSANVARVAPGEFVYPEGATVGTWIGGQRQGIQGLQLGFRVNAVADADEFQSMFGSYSTDFPAVICLRTPPPVRLPRTFFFASSGPVETSQANFTYITFQMAVNEAQPPSPGLIIPLLRREDMDAAYATRDALDAAYATRLARDNDYTKAGLAGP